MKKDRHVATIQDEGLNALQWTNWRKGNVSAGKKTLARLTASFGFFDRHSLYKVSGVEVNVLKVLNKLQRNNFGFKLRCTVLCLG